MYLQLSESASKNENGPETPDVAPLKNASPAPKTGDETPSRKNPATPFVSIY